MAVKKFVVGCFDDEMYCSPQFPKEGRIQNHDICQYAFWTDRTLGKQASILQDLYSDRRNHNGVTL
jgi:hypothetical protein